MFKKSMSKSVSIESRHPIGNGKTSPLSPDLLYTDGSAYARDSRKDGVKLPGFA
jgi:hypothetical protein